MNYTDDVIEESVAKGIALLDTTFPEWYQDIDTFRLDMGDCSRCILGQIYNHFLHGVGILSTQTAQPLNPNKTGFNIPEWVEDGEDRHEAYDRLKNEWIKQIDKRRRQ